MKKILFCLQTMICGGVEKELLTILNRFNLEEYEITVLLFYSQDEEMEKKIPQEVKLINLNINKSYYCGDLVDLVEERIKRGEWFEGLELIYKRIFKGISAPRSVSVNKLETPREVYDYAVCYHMHSPIVLKYVAEKIHAKVKYAWIHNDFHTTGFPVLQYNTWLKEYNAFYGVSKKLIEEFKNIFPIYSDIAYTCYNIVDKQDILEKADEIDDVDKSFINNKSFKIVTVGRFVEQKGFDIAIKAAGLLKKHGYEFTWYAIGYGKDESIMKSLIKKYKVSDCFVILGKKDNPYPYMSLSDIYVQTSRHEGYGITIEEAKVLKKIIVSTDFAGISEQIQNNVTGVIVEEISAEKISEAIIPFISNEDYRKDFKSRLEMTTYDDGWDYIQEVFS